MKELLTGSGRIWLSKFAIFLRRFAANVLKIANVNSKIAVN